MYVHVIYYMTGKLFSSKAAIYDIQNQIRFKTLALNHQTTRCHNPEGDCYGDRKKVTILHKFTNSPAGGVKYGAVQHQREHTY